MPPTPSTDLNLVAHGERLARLEDRRAHRRHLHRGQSADCIDTVRPDAGTLQKVDERLLVAQIAEQPLERAGECADFVFARRRESRRCSRRRRRAASPSTSACTGRTICREITSDSRNASNRPPAPANSSALRKLVVRRQLAIEIAQGDEAADFVAARAERRDPLPDVVRAADADVALLAHRHHHRRARVCRAARRPARSSSRLRSWARARRAHRASAS